MKKVKPRNYRKWTIAEKRQVIREYYTTDMNIRDLCLKYGIYPAQFYQWQRHINEAKYKTSPVEVAEHTRDPDPLVTRAVYLMDELKVLVEELSKRKVQ